MLDFQHQQPLQPRCHSRGGGNPGQRLNGHRELVKKKFKTLFFNFIFNHGSLPSQGRSYFVAALQLLRSNRSILNFYFNKSLSVLTPAAWIPASAGMTVDVAKTKTTLSML